MTDDETAIEQYVRTEVRSFESEVGSPEWATQAERLVEEVVEEIEPNDPHQQSRIAELVRGIAKDEADG